MERNIYNCLEVRPYKIISYDESTAGQNHEIKIGNRCFENVEQFRYLRTTVTYD
jgi:hypothetical protein